MRCGARQRNEVSCVAVRSDGPARSSSAHDIAQLLAVLHDAEALGEHPYAQRAYARLPDSLSHAARLAAAVQAVRAAVRHAVDRLTLANGSITPRHHAVVSRCDLRREPHRAVARELGVSRSQFYRDLAEGRHRVDQDVLERLDSIRADCADQPSERHELVRSAYALALAGNPSAATALLTTRARETRGAERTDALLTLAEILSDQGDSVGAGRRVRDAGITLDETHSPPFRARSVLLGAILRRASGNDTELTTELARLGAIVDAWQPSLCSPDETDALSVVRTFQALCAAEHFDYDTAAALLRINPAACASVGARTRAVYLTVRASHAVNSTLPPTAEAVVDEQYDFAASRGFARVTVTALLNRANLSYARLRLDDALRLASDAVKLSEAIGGPFDYALACADAAAIALAAKRHRTARILSDAATSAAAPNSRVWLRAQTTKAGLAVALGDWRSALAICDATASAASEDSAATLGMLRIRASAYMCAGDAGRARKALSAALERADAMPSAFAAARTLLLARNVIKSPRFEKRLRELSRGLEWPADMLAV